MQKIPDMKNQSNPIADLHVHLFPERMFEAVWRFFESWDWAVHRQYTEQIEQTLRDHGVTLAAGLSYPHKKGVAFSLNRFMEKVGEHSTLFRPFASVFPEDNDFKKCVDHAINSPNIHGFKFQPLVQRFDVNDPRLDYLYAPCEREGFPILMHIGKAPVANEFVGLDHFKRLIRRFPDLRVCVAHMGAPEYDGFLSMMDHHPGMYLDTTMINTRTDLFDTLWKGDPELLFRHRDRICFGSDWPNVPYSYQEAKDSVERFPLPENALRGLVYDNALRFLKIENE